MMRIFHFIKYNEQTSADHVLTLANGNTVICFDFEDSIRDWKDPSNTPKLKAYYRNCFKTILNQFGPGQPPIQIGVRINPIDSRECEFDLDSLSEERFISAIFLPKTNHVDQILDLQIKLREKRVSYGEIIPVIETKTGMNNLEEIVRNKESKIKSVAFGHCDYNLDNGLYPFFHQQSREYWTWITKMISILKPYHVSLINSPFLQLQNNNFFREMLHVLHAIGGNNVGQIVLNTDQSKISQLFPPSTSHAVSYQIAHRLDLKAPASFAKDFIRDFEQHSYGRGFAINKECILLSPHEYKASLNYLDKNSLPDQNFTFVGGCFPVQGDIIFEDLFHQIIRRRIEVSEKIKFNVNIARYERFARGLQKISTLHRHNPIDILAFSVRPEPFLRLVKLYYRFYDHVQHKRKWSLNLPFLNQLNPEKYDLLELDTGFPSSGMPRGSLLQRSLRNLNYLLGSFIGNEKRAWRKYERLIHMVIDFCRQNKIPLILLGPPIRTNRDMENLISKRLAVHCEKLVSSSKIHYVSGIGPNKNVANGFDRDGIYASEQYHELIADRMVKVIAGLMDIQYVAVNNKWIETVDRQLEEQIH